MILSPNDVFPLVAVATSPSGLIFQQQSTGDALEQLSAVGPEHHFRDAFSFQFKLNFRNICEVVIELGACRLKIFHLELQGWSTETLGIQEVSPHCATLVRNPGAIF